MQVPRGRAGGGRAGTSQHVPAFRAAQLWPLSTYDQAGRRKRIKSRESGTCQAEQEAGARRRRSGMAWAPSLRAGPARCNGLRHTQCVQRSWWDLTVPDQNRIWGNPTFGCSRIYPPWPTSIRGWSRSAQLLLPRSQPVQPLAVPPADCEDAELPQATAYCHAAGK